MVEHSPQMPPPFHFVRIPPPPYFCSSYSLTIFIMSVSPFIFIGLFLFRFHSLFNLSYLCGVLNVLVCSCYILTFPTPIPF